MKQSMLNKLKGKTFHFIGIGGISMSALAQMLRKLGFNVQGSDVAENQEIFKLKKLKIKVFNTHLESNLDGVDVVVFSSAIHEDNVELKIARKRNLKIFKRAELLGLIASEYKTVVAVAGSHGKTTTTAMISEIFLNAGLKPTIHIGGPLKLINSNYKLGQKQFFITEACEYMDNFLYIQPDIAVILNVDGDHFDYFGSIEGVKNSFFKFSKNLKDGGVCLINGDEKNNFFGKSENYAKFSMNKKCDIYAKRISEFKPGYFAFDVVLFGFNLGRIELNILGKHNILNALASVFVSTVCGVDFCTIKFSLENFSGVERRCEKIGEINGAEVFHDYAHHPRQIEKMLDVASELASKNQGRVLTVFEPHTFSRTKFLLSEFAQSFSKSDYLLLAPVYSAREDESQGKNSLDLAMKSEEFVKNVEYYETYDEILKRLKKLAKCGDVIFILGAGTIDKLAKMI